MGLEELTEGALVWTDTAGLRQVHRNLDKVRSLGNRLIESAYA